MAMSDNNTQDVFTSLTRELCEILDSIKARNTGPDLSDGRVPWKACTKRQAGRIKAVGARAKQHHMLRRVLAQCSVSYRHYWMINNGYRPSSGMIPLPWKDGDENEAVIAVEVKSNKIVLETVYVSRSKAVFSLASMEQLDCLLDTMGIDHEWNPEDGGFILVGEHRLNNGDAKGNAKVLKSLL